ncbi:hypothetical protein CC78DRAFT_535636 [Lojkania enalia]|uniref:Uncharacterized protein n=1 Tax=Lojkania enalia TaxID=147567 RepID=A0A9P4K2J7_9PLEO|nr:hypothetical protein CC78DRAFT_535636 [Didymosphaeria enalia]
MEYYTLLKLSLIPTSLLFLLSLVSIILTTHYWIIGDWFMPRIIDTLILEFDILIYYVENETNATIISGCLSVGAAIIAFLGWIKLRRSNMDSEALESTRRFWILSVVLCALASFGAALASLILHFTQQWDDPLFPGCKSEFEDTKNWLIHCTREVGACNVMPKLEIEGYNHAPTACNEARAVRWLTIPLMICDVAIIALFVAQAWVRREMRYQRVKRAAEKQVVYE